MNAHKRKLRGLLLSTGLLLTFTTSIAFFLRGMNKRYANDRPSFFPPNYDGWWPPVLSTHVEPLHTHHH